AAHPARPLGGDRISAGAAAQPGGDAGGSARRHPTEAARGGNPMKPPHVLPDVNLPPYTGGRREMIGAALAGAAGLVLTLIGALFSPQRALLAYLIAWVYWLGLAIGAMTLVMGHHAAGARWDV